MNALENWVKQRPEKHRENERWSLMNGRIYEENQLFDVMRYKSAFRVVLDYFKEWQRLADSEAQVLLVTREDYEQYYRVFPIIPYEQDEELVIVVLPQINTPSNTIISDEYWYQTAKGQPVMRIHSHHVYPAYQSATDFASLNSGTLEVVFGHINQPIPQCCYWLTRHSDVECKEKVFYTSPEVCDKLFNK